MVTRGQLQLIDPYRFEELIADLWKSKGYATYTRKKSGDRGIDVEAERGNHKEVIQVKRYNDRNKIGSSEVRKYATLYQQTDADNVVLVTSGLFTDSARKLAHDLDVDILNGDELCLQLEQSSVSLPSKSADWTSTENTGQENIEIKELEEEIEAKAVFIEQTVDKIRKSIPMVVVFVLFLLIISWIL